MGIPGVICSILLVKRVNMRMQNICGFLLIAVSFAALAICFMITPKGAVTDHVLSLAPLHTHTPHYQHRRRHHHHHNHRHRHHALFGRE